MRYIYIYIKNHTHYLERAEGEGLHLVEPGFSSWESPCSRRVFFH
jgi:hypothetical protein